MKFRFALLLAALGGVAAFAAPAAKDWNRSVSTTAAGSYVIGNPAAKTRLTEYMSYTCGHCADFSRDASAVLKRDYVANGRTSIEVRHALRDRMDFTAAILARCDGPAAFAGHSDAIFAAQGDWMTKGIIFESANQQRLQTLPIEKALAEIAKGSGLDALVRARGMTQPKINACLANTAQHTLLAAMASEAWDKRKIPGTPAFLLNGTLAPETASWTALKPRLDATLK